MTRTTLTVSLLALAAVSFGDADAQGRRVVRQIETSYELWLGDVTLPTRTGGTLTVKPCAECPTVMHRVDAETTYSVNGGRVEFDDFRTIADERRQSDGMGASMTVHVDIDSGRVTRVGMGYNRG